MSELPASRSTNAVRRVSHGTSDSPRPPAPFLVPSSAHTRHSLLALWHLLSLDAPTVATLWTLFIARTAHLSLPWPEPAAMFIAVWIIYASDRLLDARTINTDLEARHRFHHNHRNRFLTAILVATPTLIYLLTRIDPRALRLYALLASLLAVWMLLIHARPLSSHRLPKELAVGIFFPAAIFIPTIARSPDLRPSLLSAAILFACACTLNCLYLYKWEHPKPSPHTHITTRWATTHLSQIATSLLTITALLFTIHPSITNLPILACALSTATLLLLSANRDRLSPIHLRAAADLALLTPLLLLPLIR